RRNTVPLAQLLGDPEPVRGPADRRRAGRGRAPGQRRGRAARRRRDRPVHRQVSLGGHRRARRRAAAHARGAPTLPARTRRAPERDPKEITAQDKLTDELEAQIRAADSKARLEDLYLPHKPKRRTKAQIAREAGLEPLADLLLHDPSNDPHRAAANFVDRDRDVPDAGAALDGARAILVERFAEDADLLGELRESMAARGSVTSMVRAGKELQGAKFADYFEFS